MHYYEFFIAHFVFIYFQSSTSTGGTEGSSPASSPASGTSLAMAAPKYGTLVPNRIFVGGISANTSEAELAQLFSNYGNVKATKIIADRAGVSKGYGFVTFETEEEAKRLQQEVNNVSSFFFHSQKVVYWITNNLYLRFFFFCSRTTSC